MICDRNVIKLPAFISYRLKKHVKRLLYTFLYFVDKVYESICGGLSYFILGKGIVGKKMKNLQTLLWQRIKQMYINHYLFSLYHEAMAKESAV